MSVAGLHTYFFRLVAAESEKCNNDVINVCTTIRCESSKL